VVYSTSGVALWSSGTAGTNSQRLELWDDGRFIIFRSAWSTGTAQGWWVGSMSHPACDLGIGTGGGGWMGTGQCFVSPNGRYELLLQTDGNLVLYDRSPTPAVALWSTGTAVTPISPGVALQTLYTYDALGNLLRVDQKGSAPSDSSQWRTRLFTYDSLSRLLSAYNPESGTITYSYDADGDLLQKTSPAPNPNPPQPTQTISYCYDELHRPTKRDYQVHTFSPPTCPITAPVVSYVYDSGANAKGHLTSMTDQAGTSSYGYDILERLATETRSIAGISKSTSYTYNLDGSVKTLTYPSNRVVTYTPDSAGRMVSAVDSNGTSYVSSATYNPIGSLKSFLNGSTPALNSTFQYNQRLQLCRITTLTSGTPPISCADSDSQHIGNVMDRGYDFHAGNGTPSSGTDNGNVMAITNYRDANRSQAFTYDQLNRITSGSSAANTGTYSWGENYSIDAWGNLQITPMQGKAHGGTFQLSGNVQNRPTGLAYDAAGNLTSYLTASYTYDQENRLSATAGITYTYDGNGEVVLKSQTSNGAPLKRYWSMHGSTLAEADGAGNLTAEYIYFKNKRIARIDLPNTVHYYFADHLRSTSIIATSSGAIEEESDYYPFGTEVVVTGPGTNELKFTGKRRGESQLDYFGARYYANIFGRFTQPDEPLADQDTGEPQSWNLYAYARNSPIKNIDPDGFSCLKTDDGHTIDDGDGKGCPEAGIFPDDDPNSYDLWGHPPAQQFDLSKAVQSTPDYSDPDVRADFIATTVVQNLSPHEMALVTQEAGMDAMTVMTLTGAWKDLAAAERFTALNIGRYASGQAFKKVIMTSEGPLEITAKIEVEGDTITLKTFSVAHEDGVQVVTNPGVGELKAALDAVKSEMKEAGFSTLKIRALSIRDPVKFIEKTFQLK
jgi:RHS repeat-associated protein